MDDGYGGFMECAIAETFVLKPRRTLGMREKAAKAEPGRAQLKNQDVMCILIVKLLNAVLI